MQVPATHLTSFLSGIAASAAVLSSGPVQATAHAAAPSRPNIIFILADDAGYGDVGFNGQARFNTPNIDRLAREGMIMTRHYAGSPVCAPSRAALMTGLHTGHGSIRGNLGYSRGADTPGRIPISRREKLIPEYLKDFGYQTAMIGKWGLGEEDSYSAPWLRGWDFFYGFVNQAHAHNQYPEFLYRNAAKEPLVQNYSHGQNSFANDRFTVEALAYIDRAAAGAGHPFFLYMAYTTPHADLVCPRDTVMEQLKKEQAWVHEIAGPDDAVHAEDPQKKAIEGDKRIIFAAMMMRLDRDVGLIMDRLKERGLDESTLVVFTSDNGPHAEGGKDNTFFHSSGGLRGIKRDMYEGGIREPFAIRWPGHIRAGSTSDHPAAFWDFMPTVFEILGEPVPADIDGISYAPTLLGRAESQKKHDYLYWELEGRQAILQNNWKAVRNGMKAGIELYDLSRDPSERSNLSSQNPGKVEYFERLMASARVNSTAFPLGQPVAKGEPDAP
ncbi:arylsulfatase [Termitidicoccus mucosus]|uniref:Sulfatase N-terminal domain-containing protein n=1 Tax=Termitidicoccus mucosus TaxID=1184151 RepID=A0A178IDS8_9BACT|nr:hypothetical protein AW736_18525 [Opitutaceae bacterium TSB47]